MTTYRVTGVIDAYIMHEVPNTNIVTWKWQEIAVNEIVEADSFDDAREQAEGQARSGYDIKRLYWQTGPYLDRP